jgi:hypothetical protein
MACSLSYLVHLARPNLAAQMKRRWREQIRRPTSEAGRLIEHKLPVFVFVALRFRGRKSLPTDFRARALA